MMHKTVREVMTAYPRTANSTTTVLEAARMLEAEDIGSLPVVDGAQLVGMVTDRDIVTRVVAAGKDPAQVRVGELATREVVTVDPRDDLDAALELMAEHQVRRLPVVEDGAVVGMLAQADVAMAAKEKAAGEMLEQISQPTTGS
jgi:CBS domain-containing protein